MTAVAVLDCETTTKNKGDPYNPENKLCYVGIRDEEGNHLYNIDYTPHPQRAEFEDIVKRLERVDLVVAFNAKFDLSWLLSYIPTLKIPDIWDCQVVEYSLSGQQQPYPSLNGALADAGLPLKLDVVKEEFWDKGFDTTDVPEKILKEYLAQDLICTELLFKHQLEILSQMPNLHQLHKMLFKDTKILMMAQKHGLNLDVSLCKERDKEVQAKIGTIQETLNKITGEGFNWNSPMQKSIFFYGGMLGGTGYPRRVEPPSGSESSKTIGKSDEEVARYNEEQVVKKRAPLQRIYATDEPTLLKLKGVPKELKGVIDLCLELKRLEKLSGTYYQGIPEILELHHWKDNLLHGNYNQCVTRTGRLSSSSPNMQNFSGEIKDVFRTRFS